MSVAHKTRPARNNYPDYNADDPGCYANQNGINKTSLNGGTWRCFFGKGNEPSSRLFIG